jgi:hypothetical protein
VRQVSRGSHGPSGSPVVPTPSLVVDGSKRASSDELVGGGRSKTSRRSEF